MRSEPNRRSKVSHTSLAVIICGIALGGCAGGEQREERPLPRSEVRNVAPSTLALITDVQVSREYLAIHDLQRERLVVRPRHVAARLLFGERKTRWYGPPFHVTSEADTLVIGDIDGSAGFSVEDIRHAQLMFTPERATKKRKGKAGKILLMMLAAIGSAALQILCGAAGLAGL